MRHVREDSERSRGWSWTYHVVAASRLRASERAQVHCGAASVKNFRICNFYRHICVLLIKTNPMIYNMLKYGVKVVICVLAVGDDELDVRDDDDASSEVAGRAGRRGEVTRMC